MKKFMIILILVVVFMGINDMLAAQTPKIQPRSQVIKRLCINRAVANTQTFDELTDKLQECF